MHSEMCNIFKSFRTNLFFYVLVLCLILFSDDTYWFSTSGNQLFVSLKFVFIFVLPVFLFIKGARLSEKHLFCISFIGILLILTTVLTNSSLGGVSILIFTIISALLLSNKYKIQDFSRVYTHILTFIMLYSLCIWTFLSLSVIQPVYLENLADSVIQSYGGCIFFGGSFNGLRNSAFFREPGMYMVYICLGYIFDAFILKNKIPQYKMLLYLVSIISTFSTAGFIIFPVLYVLSVFNGLFSRRNIVIPIVLFITAVALSFSSETIYNNVFGKLNSSSSEASSSISRISSIFVPLNIMLNNPFLGIGTGFFREVYIKEGYSLYHMILDPSGQGTNTFFNAGALFGIWFFCFLLVGICKFVNNCSSKINVQIGLYIAFFMIFSNETMVYSILLYLLLFYGFNSASRFNN